MTNPTMTKCDGQVRFLSDGRGVVRLQQAWRIIEFEDGLACAQRIEWRDVPVIKVEDADKDD